MRPSRVGEKRPRDAPAPFDFIPGLKLSQHPSEQRKDLFMKKLKGIINCKSLHPTQFEGYTIKERFQRMGWENLLSFNCDKIYKRVVIQWMASLSRTGDGLTGIVDGKAYTITPRIIRDLLGVDTRTDLPYMRFKEVDFEAGTAENKVRWTEACKAVFGIEENAEKENQGYRKLTMTPLAKVLWIIAESTLLPGPSESRLLRGPASLDVYKFDFELIHLREIHLLHALLTGDYLYSFAHLMIDEIWDMYEQEDRQYIPYGNYISEILSRLGAVSEDEYVEVVSPEYCVISVDAFGSLGMLTFSRSPTEYIIDDRNTRQRITFPKKGTREGPPQPQPTNQISKTCQYMPPQMSVPNSNVELTNVFTKFQNLIDKQSSIFQKKYNEMKTTVTNMQKQMERQTEEAERREQEREKLGKERERKQYDEMKTMVTDMQKQMEHHASEAQMRAHAIIWDIERQRYFYEMEQEQLQMAWNQLNGANGVDEFQFPQMCRTSLHPPQEGSPYYDPAQGDDEIPKAFQPLYQDIYGLKRKKPSSP